MRRVLEGFAIFILSLPVEAAPVSKNEPNLSLTLRIYDCAAVPEVTLAQADSGNLQSAAQGRLRLTAEQSHRMRDEVLRCSSQSPGAELKIKPALQVRVQVYNGARVSSRDLLRAEEGAARVFKKANITVVWTAASMPTALDPEAAHEQWVPGDLQLRIWTRSLARPSMIDSDALGFCTSIEGGQAVVLFDAVRSLVSSRFSNPADLLGLAIAHEMGHILLRSVDHSTTGIMRPRWLPNDLHDAEKGALVFTREQVDSMRNEVRRRMGQTDRKPDRLTN